MLRLVLLFLNALSLGLIFTAAVLSPAGKALLAAVVCLNILFLLWREPATAKARNIGALCSLFGYLGSAAAAWVFVLRCGVAFVDQGCAAVVSPIFIVTWTIGLMALPVCYAGHYLTVQSRQRPVG